MQLPVTVLNANTKREQGRKAQLGNIMAAKVDTLTHAHGARGVARTILARLGMVVGRGGVRERCESILSPCLSCSPLLFPPTTHNKVVSPSLLGNCSLTGSSRHYQDYAGPQIHAEDVAGPQRRYASQ